MERRNKIKWLAFTVLMLAGTGYFVYISQPYEETVWVPQNAVIVNFVNDTTFVNLDDIQISGTAFSAKNFTEYKEKLSNIGDTTVSIIKPSEGGAGFSIYYITKTEDKTYYYQDESVYIGMLGDYKFFKQAGLLKAHYTRNIWALMLGTIILLFVGLLIINPNFKNLKESLKNIRGKKI